MKITIIFRMIKKGIEIIYKEHIVDFLELQLKIEILTYNALSSSLLNLFIFTNLCAW